MHNLKQGRNRVHCPDVSNEHTERFLSTMKTLENTEIMTNSIGFSKLPFQKSFKQLVTRFDQGLMREPRYKEADASNLEILEAFNYLSCWSDGFNQFEQLTQAVGIFNDTAVQEEYRDLAVGSTSASYGLPSGYMCVTVDNGLGCAQAMIHELAHQKLRLMGIDEKSPISPFCSGSEIKKVNSILDSRIHCFVNKAFHDLYAYMHILELDLNIYRNELPDDVKENVQQLLSKNVIRVSSGVSELLPKLEYTPEWEKIMNEIQSWGLGLVDEVVEVLKATPYRMYNIERKLNHAIQAKSIILTVSI